MIKKFLDNNIRLGVGLLAILAIVGIGGFWNSETTEAAAPVTGSVSAIEGVSVSWVGTLTGTPPAANGEPSCVDSVGTVGNCDTYTLTVNGNPADWTGKRIRVRLTWLLPANDYDMVVRKETNGVPGLQGDGVAPPATLDDTIGTSGNGTNTEEEVVISPADTGTGIYYIRSVYFAAAGPGDPYQGTASVFSPGGVPAASSCAVPTFDEYRPPSNIVGYNSAGEPSIGANWNTGNTMFQAYTDTIRYSFIDQTSPATVNYRSSRGLNQLISLDPIMFTDPITGRTIAGQLIAAGGSQLTAISDDDGETWTSTITAGGPVQGVDHQSINGGPPNPTVIGRQPITAYPHMVYYASQQIAYGSIATSLDGGLTFGSAVPMWTLAQCSGLHGHVRVAPDGTVYVPNKNCGGKASVAVSTDNGLTWSIRQIPSSSAGDNDPTIGIGAGGRLYVAYTASDKHPRIATSDDRGLTWRDDFDLGTTFGITASVFPTAVAGDNDRAAAFFLATDSTAPGDPTGDDAGTPYKGTWYPYIATTCDGGKTWTTVRAGNVAQQGVVCTSGTTCPSGTRNLLDFNGMTVDRRGRILAGYADGCQTTACLNRPLNQADRTGNDGTDLATVIRQRGGMRLFAAFDPGGPAPPPLAPPVNVVETKKGYEISWLTPDDGGAELTTYRIYRGYPNGKEELIAQVKASVHAFTDKVPQDNHYYKVGAVNKFGESPRNIKFFPR